MTKQEIRQALINVDLKENYHADLFDISNEVFAKDYEFVEGFGSNDFVKHKQGSDVFEVLFKQDGKVRLFRFSNVEAMDKFKHLRGAMTKILLESGFKPD